MNTQALLSRMLDIPVPFVQTGGQVSRSQAGAAARNAPQKWFVLCGPPGHENLRGTRQGGSLSEASFSYTLRTKTAPWKSSRTDSKP